MISLSSSPEGLPVELETVPQYVERALQVEFLDQCRNEHGFQANAVEAEHLCPQGSLCILQESEDARRKQRAFFVPLRIGAGLPPGLAKEDFLDVGFKGFFSGLALSLIHI